MTDTSGYAQAYQQASEAFGKFVPGFEFLQGLVKNAGKSMPSMGQWIAPTLDPEELERRIEELKTVQFWLEQNARMIGATVQALEVQRMTLGALKGMNVSMGDLTEALKVKVPDIFTAAAESVKAASAPAPTPAPAPKAAASKPTPPIDEAHSDDAPPAGSKGAAGDATSDGSGPAIDPMQWWGALTQQFTALASQAMQATSEAARQATEAARQATEATSDATAQAVQAAQAAAEAAAEAAKPMTEAVRQATAPAPRRAAPKAAAKAETPAATASASATKAATKKAPVRKAAPRKTTPRAGT